MRVTPEKIRDAFKALEMTPMRQGFRVGEKCCGLVALSLHVLGEEEVQRRQSINGLTQTIISVTEESLIYGVGFINGWDGISQDVATQRSQNFQGNAVAQFMSGYQDGVSAWEAVQDLIPQRSETGEAA